jgi:uncharacterized protein YkvS
LIWIAHVNIKATMKLNLTLGLTYTYSLNDIVSPHKSVINHQNTKIGA